ncbi:MAG: SDR family oxidoreductase [Gammaproteobacteria bacterium]|nr:SDR family oxidoreductase [Gammaproteobacteria bacterium]MDH4253972.1 SDR family oxidoreductase [Gammaproteobacteria bacterium]MDH5308887.1 SDR family oxidoreductase [Gammaproteobacteria bacterium]
MRNPLDLTGRRAVVTGGAGGLGLAIAHALSHAGAQITVIDLDRALAGATLPSEWRTVAMDLGAADSLADLRRLAMDLGTLDIAIANAGLVPPWRGVAELDAGEWQRVMAVNTWGVAATLGGFTPALARSGRGAMVVMASINGYKAHPRQVLYTASKHAVIGIMRAAALDLGRHGIRVNALAPGPIATSALQQRIADRHAAGGPDVESALAVLHAETALGSIATESQVAGAALWLASDASAGITGVVLPVEAGLP